MKYKYTIEGLDYYLHDNKIICVPSEEYLSYRIGEIHQDVQDKIDESRIRGRTVSHAMIDTLIKYQEETVEKAVAYIGYKCLGTHGYLDVFGNAAGAKWERQQHERQTHRMEDKIDIMQQQLLDMQQLLLNLAQQDNVRMMRRTG